MLTIWLLIKLSSKFAEKADFSDYPAPIADIWDN